MTKTEKVINWALSQEHKKATDYSFNTEWCALFVSKALSQADYIMQGANAYSCTSQMMYWKSKGIWNDGISNISDKCIVYYDWDMSGDCDHVGFIYNKTDNVIHTIEGNTLGGTWVDTSVNKMNRNVFNNIRGYVRLEDIFNESLNTPSKPVYYSKNHTNTDNAGKCQLIQHMLNVTDNAGLTEDGILGVNTDNAIKSFQRKYHLEVDGVIGDETLFKLVQIYFNIPLENFKI